MYVVIRQLLLLRDEFRIPKLTYHSDLLHSTLEKIPLFTPKLCGLDIGPGPQIARSVRSAAPPAIHRSLYGCRPTAIAARGISAIQIDFALGIALRRRAASRRALQVQKLGGTPPKNLGAKNMQNFRQFSTTSDFDGEYLGNG